MPRVKKNPAPLETAAPKENIKARITTTRGPFWQGRALQLNECAEIPAQLFKMLEERGWACRDGQ